MQARTGLLPDKTLHKGTQPSRKRASEMRQYVSNAVEFSFVCPLANGLHARPASQLAEFASKFISEFSLTNLRSGAAANLKSTLAIISADVREGDKCSVHIFGEDEDIAAHALQKYINGDLPKSDGSTRKVEDQAIAFALPRALLSSGVTCYSGVPVSPGIGKGKTVVVGAIDLPSDLNTEEAEDPEKEEQRVQRAMAAVRKRIETMLGRSLSQAETGVLQAHLSILEDVTFTQKISGLIAEGHSAAKALIETGQFFTSLLQRSDSAYIRDRAVDVQEICLRLLEEVQGPSSTAAQIELIEPSVLVAETLAPQQLLGLDRKWLSGLVLEYAGTTSHTVILARSLGIPTLVGVKDAPVVLPARQEIVIDANRGFVVPNGNPSVHRFYEREWQTQRGRQLALSREVGAAAVTADGHRLEVAANVSSGEEVISAFSNGAEGIGLFRTEMLFMGRDRAPTEEEQFAIYADAARSAKGRVIIRTIDIGGDKPIPHLNLASESNPYLGYRGIRIYAEHRELFRTQLRAVLRASAFGRIQIMAPMVSTVEEVLWLKQQIAELQQELQHKEIAFDPGMLVGIMIEVPSVAFILDHLCAEADFFSIGTNDLNQYFMAVDRDNARVANLSNVRHPGFLRFLKHIVDSVHRHGKWIGMCGEMASDARNLPILLGLGLDEISVASAQIPVLRRNISRFSFSECKELLSRLLTCARVEQVENLLDNYGASERFRPLLDPGLVITNSESQTKEEAIRELIDSLYIAGRTENPDRLEEVVWTRESAYSTGLGHGFAIPHCRRDAVSANSVAILKLRDPIDWGSLDQKPVSTVILLAVRESDVNNTHMQVLAKLARKLMNEQFRQELNELDEPQQILRYLSEQLEIPM
jgi:phosphoenolpyruvate-protein phosphotransferase